MGKARAMRRMCRRIKSMKIIFLQSPSMRRLVRLERAKAKQDHRPTSTADACAGCGRSVRAPAGRIPIEDLEQADRPGSYAITRRYGGTRACTQPHAQ